MKERSDLDLSIGARLKQFRRQSRLSMTDVGNAVGVTYQQIQKYETGANKVSIEKLIELADLFEVPLAALLPSLQTEKEGVISVAHLNASDRVLVENLVEALGRRQGG